MRIHQPIEGRQKCKHAEVGIPTTQTDPGGADEDSPDYEPIAHISPYRRIDPSHPGRKRVITLDEWQASGSTRKPDPAIYSYDARNRRWVLKVEAGSRGLILGLREH